jgi:hypothetical protein
MTGRHSYCHQGDDPIWNVWFIRKIRYTPIRYKQIMCCLLLVPCVAVLVPCVALLSDLCVCLRCRFRGTRRGWFRVVPSCWFHEGAAVLAPRHPLAPAADATLLTPPAQWIRTLCSRYKASLF